MQTDFKLSKNEEINEGGVHSEQFPLSGDSFCSITLLVSKQAVHHDNRLQPGAAAPPGDRQTEGKEMILEGKEN